MESYMSNATFEQALRDQIRGMKCRLLGTLTVAEGSNSATLQVTGTIAYTIDGSYYTKATEDNIAMTACAVQPTYTRCRYLVSIDKAGAVTVTKGTNAASLTTGAITTVSVDGRGRYTSTAASFLSFAVKDWVNITGFTSDGNNGIFRIAAKDTAGYWIEVEEKRSVVEAAGDSVTIIRESVLPDLPIAQCAIAILIVTTTTSTFTSGTTDLGSLESVVQLCEMPTGLIN